MSRLWTEEQFNCPVCLDLPFEPVTIPCGHSYCMECITDFWDSERKKTGSCSCPECRQNFDPRPRLCRNTMLAEAVEQLRVGNLSSKARESIRDARRAAAAASERSARDGGGRVPSGRQLPASSAPCGRCVEPRAAVKTCLTCMASFCEDHLKPHETQAKLKSHELIAPTADLTQKICPEHKYLQEFYCRSCQTYICWLCTSNQHKEHESVSTQAERAEKQKTLLAVQTENLQKLQDRERELKDMKKVLETLKCSSVTASEETETVLDELQRSVQRLADLIQQVMSTSGQEKINESKQVVDKLEMEIRQLRKKDSDLKDLVTCQDNIYFLRTYQCLCSPELSELGSVTANLETSFDPVRNIISDLREKVENMCNQELEKINKSVFNTTAFTITDRQSGQKPGILKLFSAIGGKTSSSRTQGPPPLPSVSVRGPAERATNSPRPRASYNREEREQANNRSVSSLRPRERQRREEREQEREIQSTARSQSRQNSSTNKDEADTSGVQSLRQSTHRRENQEQADTWSLSSVRSRGRQRRDESETANGEVQGSQKVQDTAMTKQQPEKQSDTWSLSSVRSRGRQRRDESETANGEVQGSQKVQDTAMTKQQPERQSDTWSLSSIRSIRGREKKEENKTANADVQSQQQMAPVRQQPERQSDRWSLSSLLPKNRKKRQESVKQATPIQQEIESPQDQWGNQTEVNPGIFLDSPSSDSSFTPAFPTSPSFSLPPALREIDIDSIQAPEPRNRDEFLQYACDLTFDPNTAHRRLVLSEDDTKATLHTAAQSYPDVPERFDSWTQILSLQPISSTRCYWEVEWRGRGSSVGVASASMPRKGADAKAGLGYNNQSWSLELSDMFCAAMHANQKQEISVTYCPRVGVFLNQEEESLSFYGVDDVLMHLHTFHSVSCSQPLFAAFGVGSGVGVGLDFAMGNFSASTDSIKICSI
ncbi:E3 ubiquitin/ISG15 ligase TRIM25 isoform X2 [Silurus meridionalis]|uniref:E3 ubiquitin/ISG15 ligase TRIM25 isoform X2 n=1 Tax=Silurus meridionalis TaxID=175797 RepID=UPI001EEB60A2|nr:E3 ubiquitin/ISG15 ligase TRIM25 isoform X2 [Silurus meridionalis]